MKKILSTIIIAITSFAGIAQDKQEVNIKIIPVSENISMLVGQGGNIAVLTGEDGTIMIDDQFARLSEKIMASIKTLSDKPVKYLVNTHFHGDHTGGNANFQEQGALILAHDNVRKRLAADEKNKDGKGLPIITFDSDVSLHLNNNDILIYACS